MSARPFQVLPALSLEEHEALLLDIGSNGVLVPILVDQHGRTLDGHHRREIAAELGLDCPSEIRMVADDEEARAIALTLNLSRRHLSRRQRRELIASEIAARPDDSDRAVAGRFGCSKGTVGSIRRRVAKLATLGEEIFPDSKERAEVAALGGSEDEFGAALAAAEAEGDLSGENVGRRLHLIQTADRIRTDPVARSSALQAVDDVMSAQQPARPSSRPELPEFLVKIRYVERGLRDLLQLAQDGNAVSAALGHRDIVEEIAAQLLNLAKAVVEELKAEPFEVEAAQLLEDGDL